MRHRVLAVGCFLLAGLALPWGGLGVWGASILLPGPSRHSSTEAGVGVLGILVGAPLMFVGALVVALAYPRLVVGWHLWRGTTPPRPWIGAIALAAMVGNSLGVATLLYSTGWVRDNGALLTGVLALTTLSLSSLAHAMGLWSVRTGQAERATR